MEGQEDMLERMAIELGHIAMGEKTYPEYDKNNEEHLQYPTLAHRLKAMEMLAKLLAVIHGGTGQQKRTVLVDDI